MFRATSLPIIRMELVLLRRVIIRRNKTSSILTMLGSGLQNLHET